MLLNSLSFHLSEVDRHDDALKIAQEALFYCRELESVNRNFFLPDLAISLNNLSVYLSKVGHHEEAQKIADEAAILLSAAGMDRLPGRRK
jgi:tetratricopeptide (TPR) repeat protein